MKLLEKKQKEVTVIVDVICDSCGKTCNTHCGHEYMELKANWGYASKKDMERWVAQICETCVDEKFGFIKFNKEDITFQTYLGTDSGYEKRMEEDMNSVEFNNLGGKNPSDDSLKK